MKVKVSETERTVGEHVTLLRDREVIICDVDYYASLFLLFIFYFFIFSAVTTTLSNLDPCVVAEGNFIV